MRWFNRNRVDVNTSKGDVLKAKGDIIINDNEGGDATIRMLLETLIQLIKDLDRHLQEHINKKDAH